MVQKNACTNVDVEAVTGCIAEQATREISGRENKNTVQDPWQNLFSSKKVFYSVGKLYHKNSSKRFIRMLEEVNSTNRKKVFLPS